MMYALPFALISLVHLVGEAVASKPVRYLSKPLLMPALALYYLMSTEAFSWIMAAALAGGWLGDIFLMIPDRDEKRRFFKLGLVAFLLGHLFYVWAFLAWGSLGQLPVPGMLSILFFVGYGVVVFIKLKPYMGALFVPITAYIIVIVLMGVSTGLCTGTQNLPAGFAVVIGALIFMVSDTLNAWNRFAREIPYERILTMATYLGGQFLLVYGYVQFV
ncbi:MAG TPA: hypothetical protein DHV36_09920 [Desulfobacteraceae bacterium]|nr:hypothetical protein [Desulfobacteraceae bacterium]